MMKAFRITSKLSTLFIVLTLIVSLLPITTARAQSASLTIKALGDTFVYSGAVTKNYGLNTQLKIDGSPVYRSYVKYDVKGVNGRKVTGAKLRFYVVDDSHSGFDVAKVDNATWKEAAVTYQNAPAVGAVLATSGEYGVKQWVEIDITGSVSGDGLYAFALQSSADTTTALSSSESSNSPQLVLSLENQAAVPTTAPTKAPTAAPTTPPVAPTAAPSGNNGNLELAAVADATVRSDAASTNYGKATDLNADVSPMTRSYMRFNVPSFSGSITSAKLRFYVTDASASGFSVAKVSDNAWSETGITYTNAPATGSALRSTGPISNNVTIDLDVTGSVTASGLVSFAMITTYDTTMAVAAREAGTNGPRLILTTSGSDPAPTTMPTTVPTKAPTAVPTVAPTKSPTTAPTAAPTKAPTAIPTSSGSVKPYGNIAGTWNLKFSDEFNGTTLDLNKWEPNWLAGNDTAITKPINGHEVSCYDPKQVSVSDGSLKLSAAARSCAANNGVTYKYASGIVTSRPHYTFTYGYMEARMWSDGSSTIKNWPAFWADGTGTWPTTGEIDVYEGLNGRASWHFHYGTPSDDKSVGGYPSLSPQPGWHIFGAEWTSSTIKFYYDGVYAGQVTSGVTGSPMFLILNYGLSDYISPPIQVPSYALVDYVRVWQH